MDKILILGGSGNIGKYLMNNIKYPNISTVSSEQCDLTSFEEINSYFSKDEKINTIIFLVGLAHKKGKKTDYNKFNLINYRSLKNIMTFFNDNNIVPDKIIFASTISIYGESFERSVYDEKTKTNPKSPYAITKLKAENYLVNNFPNQAWILRISPVYSRKFMLNIDRRTKIINYYFQVSEGSNLLSLCNISNIYQSIINIIENNIPNGIYNLSDEINYSLNQLIKFQNPRYVIKIPRIFVKLFYFIGLIINNIFLIENSIKLLSDNLYPSNKIREYIDLPYNLYSIKK